MKRSRSQKNSKDKNDASQKKQAPRNQPSGSDRIRPANFIPLAEIPSSFSSSEDSENDSRNIWTKYKVSSEEKMMKNRTDSYKLTFPLHRERRVIENENIHPGTTKYPTKPIGRHSVEGLSNPKGSASTIRHPTPPRRYQIFPKNVDVQHKTEITQATLEKSMTLGREQTVASIYAAKSTKQTPEARQRKKKAPFSGQPDLSGHIKELLDEGQEQEVKAKVSFSHYAKLNDRIEKLESLLSRQDSDISEELNELHRLKDECFSDGNSSRLDALHRPFQDPIVFTQRVRRLRINTEICQYYVLYGIITTLGLILIAMTAIWVWKYNGGLSDKINLHILLSMIGFLFMSTQGILAFRTIRYLTREKTPEIYWKGTIAHTVVHLVSVVLSCSSMVMAFLSRGATIPPSNNMYTLHAWIGIVTFVFYCLLWLCSLLFFLPQMLPSIFRVFLPTHVALGMTSFFLIISSCLSGFMEEVMWSLGDAYSGLPAAGVLVNCIGVLIMVYCGFVIYITQTVKDV